MLGISSLCPAQSHEAPPPSSQNGRSQLLVDPEQCTDHIRNSYCLLVGSDTCNDLTVKNSLILSCTLNPGTGTDLSIRIVKRVKDKSKEFECLAEDVVAELPNAVSYKRTVNFREKFDRFVEFGVGGLKKEIDELYRRAFASRG